MSDRRTHVAKEVLTTERTFVKYLRVIVDVCRQYPIILRKNICYSPHIAGYNNNI